VISRWSHRLRTSVLAPLIACVLLAGVITAFPAAPAAAPGEVGTAAALTRPNIILFLTDDQTIESLARMPYLNSRTDWVRFDNAWANNALCCPARATLLQGRYDTHTRVLNNRHGWRFNTRETLPVWLQREGYRTGLIGKYLNGLGNATDVPPGWNSFQVVTPSSVSYSQYNYTLVENGVARSYGSDPADYQVDVLTTRAESFVQTSANLGTPFFLYFAPTATHGPWVASPRRTGMFRTTPVPRSASFNETDVSDKPRWVHSLQQIDFTTIQNQRRREWAAGVSVDDALRALDQQLIASGVFDNTVLVFLTDNGYSFHEHRHSGKMCEYTECAHTPILIRYPGVSGRSIRAYATNVDIAPTVADIAGATPALPQDGRSLVPWLLGEPVTQWRRGVLQHWSGGDNVGGTGHGTAIPEFWTVRSHRNGRPYAYTELATGEKELYDLAADPAELENIAGDPAVAAVQESLRVQLANLRADAQQQVATLDTQPLPAPPSGPLLVDEASD
jgi:N-acetylglucosamine-6-sulfatase